MTKPRNPSSGEVFFQIPLAFDDCLERIVVTMNENQDIATVADTTIGNAVGQIAHFLDPLLDGDFIVRRGQDAGLVRCFEKSNLAGLGDELAVLYGPRWK